MDQGTVPHQLIRASAGTGKTFQLTNRYIRLLADGVSADRILATTFTRKAAGEILNRILLRLASAASSADAAAQLADAIGRPELRQDDFTIRLRHVVQKLHQLRVGTLDSLFARVAAVHAWELRLPAGWGIGEQTQLDRLRDASVRDVLQNEATQEISQLLQLIRRGDASQLVHGDLRATIEELHTVYRHAPASAWTEIQPRTQGEESEPTQWVQRLLSVPLPDTTRFLKGRAEDVRRFEQEDWKGFFDKGISGKILQGETTYYRVPLPKELVEAYLTLINHAQTVVRNQIAVQTSAAFELMKKYDVAFRRQQRISRVYHFDDLVDVLQNAANIEGDASGGMLLGASVDHLLLDEFQDTSLEQWEILLPLAARIMAPKQTGDVEKVRPSFFCVGDAKQSIYGWRGGEPKILQKLPQQLSGLMVSDLNESRRSAPVIMDTVNQLFQGMVRHPNLDHYEQPIVDWCQAFPSHTTARTDLTGYAELRSGGYEEGDDGTIRVAAEIVQSYAESAVRRTIAVLMRNNDGVTHMADRLRNLGITVSEEGGTSLRSVPAVALFLAFFRWLDHPDDGPSRYHLQHSPLAEQLAMADPARSHEVARVFRRKLLVEGYGRVVLELVRSVENLFTAQERLRLRQLVDLAFAYQPHTTLRPCDFLRYVETERAAESVVAAVRVMTIHQSKGLEFDIVVLPQLDEPIVRQNPRCVIGRDDPVGPIKRVTVARSRELASVLPARMQRDYDVQLEHLTQESLCMLYVAVTRARHALHMVIPKSRLSTSSREPSLHKTLAGLVRAALVGTAQLQQPNEVVWSAGDAQWHATGESVTSSVSAAVPGMSLPARIEFRPTTRPPRRWVRPSELGDHAREPGRRRWRWQARGAATQLGSLIHAWLERVSWLEEGLPGPEIWHEIALQFGCEAQFVGEAQSRAQDLLAMPALADLLRQSRYAPSSKLAQLAVSAEGPIHDLDVGLWRELRFAFRDRNRWLSGAMDRVVVLRRSQQVVAAEVIDFKSDDVARSDDLFQRADRYRAQMEAYRSAVQRLFKLPASRVQATLVFLSSGEVIPLTDAPPVPQRPPLRGLPQDLPFPE